MVNNGPMNFQLQVARLDNYCRIQFPAMASACEILLDTTDLHDTLRLGELAQTETLRIERKFSRYRDDNIVYRINQAGGHNIEVDDETADLIDFSNQLYELSEGRFDITSGLLRQVWRFDGSDKLPTAQAVAALLPRIGWNKVQWQRPHLQLPAGMEIDLGGIGKEYAVDKVFNQLRETFSGALLVNFGGDLRAHGPRADGTSWQVGVEPIDAQTSPHCIELSEGALATSGDSQRFLLKDGVRYSHILNPQNGWPVTDAPHAITVYAPTCVQAGVFSTLALMQGKDAESFLQNEGIRFWCVR